MLLESNFLQHFLVIAPALNGTGVLAVIRRA
jgi:hypothetical protein